MNFGIRKNVGLRRANGIVDELSFRERFQDGVTVFDERRVLKKRVRAIFLHVNHIRVAAGDAPGIEGALGHPLIKKPFGADGFELAAIFLDESVYCL